MRKVIAIGWLAAAMSCSPLDKKEVFVKESGLQLCPGIQIRLQLQDKPPPHGIDYKYNIYMENIAGCKYLTKEYIQSAGYVCENTNKVMECTKFFSGGALAKLKVDQNSAEFIKIRHQ
jgi:hypothetical protein